jgi:hypothetical protein
LEAEYKHPAAKRLSALKVPASRAVNALKWAESVGTEETVCYRMIVHSEVFQVRKRPVVVLIALVERELSCWSLKQTKKRMYVEIVCGMWEEYGDQIV